MDLKVAISNRTLTKICSSSKRGREDEGSLHSKAAEPHPTAHHLRRHPRGGARVLARGERRQIPCKTSKHSLRD